MKYGSMKCQHRIRQSAERLLVGANPEPPAARCRAQWRLRIVPTDWKSPYRRDETQYKTEAKEVEICEIETERSLSAVPMMSTS